MPHLLELSARSRELLDVLLNGKGDAGALYEGALRVLSDTANPVRVRQAAYSLRELMDELERVAGFVRQGQPLTDRVRQLLGAWKLAHPLDLGYGDQAGVFMLALEEFFRAFEADYPARTGQASDTIARLDPAQRNAPPAVQEALVKQWMAFRRYYNSVLHGQCRDDEGAFRSQLARFESFLLDWFRPLTFGDFDVIDALLAKGPPDG